MRWAVVIVAALAGAAAADDTVQTRHRTRVLAAIGGRRIGTIAAGARVAVRRAVTARDACGTWLELATRGWVCAKDVAPSADPPDAATAQLDDADYAGIDRGTLVYADVQSIEEGAPTKSVHAHTIVALRDATVRVYGKLYVRTDQGWIAQKDLGVYAPSQHAGVTIAPDATLDAAWLVPRERGVKVIVRAAPDKTATIVREVRARERVVVRAIDGGFVAIGEGEWVADRDVRRAQPSARPDGIGDGERWIDVDLDHQVLVAYDGDTPVFATVVSTGLGGATPTGIYRIRGKDVRTRMTNPAEVPDEWGWNVADVPYAMRFRKNFALHGAYWHDGFGRVMSQGCVNLSPKDARWLFDFASPDAPPGWLSIEADGERGTPVRIRSARDPEPRWLDFEGKPMRVALGR